MANNLVEYLAQLRTKDPNRANWLFDCSNVGTNTFGFIKPKLVKEIIAGSKVTYDFKSAYSSNPTISPVLSRAKVSVCAIWIPMSLYVPAFRDGVEVKAGKDDYSFPTINFDYPSVYDEYLANITDHPAQSDPLFLAYSRGKDLPYVPSNSIFSELGMWSPGYQPIAFAYPRQASDLQPQGRNAIPLLGYLDFFRHYIMNSQVKYAPMRITGYSVSGSQYYPNGVPIPGSAFNIQEPEDYSFTRETLDTFFADVRRLGSVYPQGENEFDITTYLSRIGLSFPLKKVNVGYADSSPAEPYVFCFNDDHFGELRATYFADQNTAFLSNENVEYERSTARVVADDGVITMEQIYAAERVQNFVRRTIFKNSDYAEFIDAEYGITPPTNLTKPLFLGKVSSWISFNDVISQAQTSDDTDVDSNTSLGSRSSLGFGRMVTGKLASKEDRHFVSFTAREPGYLMVLEWIVPEISYFQGYDSIYDKRTLGSLYFPAFEKDGYQDKHLSHLIEMAVNPDEGFKGFPIRMPYGIFNSVVAQEPAWWEYMSMYNKMSGQMVDEGVYRHWVFHREYELPLVKVSDAPENPQWSFSVSPSISATNIYVNPEDFTHIFANTQGLDNFQTFYKHDLKIYQPLSHRFLSY